MDYGGLSTKDKLRRYTMPTQVECPECKHKFEVTNIRGEKGDYGYTVNTIGDEIGKFYVEGLSKDEVSMKFFAKDGKLHTGRVNRVFSELNQLPEFAQKRADYLRKVGKKDPHARKTKKVKTDEKVTA